MTEHRFGGPWTEIKLDAVEYYLTCYTKALRATSFDLWYIDAFAGSGERTVEQETGGLFERRPIAITTETLAGSARRALSVEPTFHHFVFIERDQKRCLALNSLKSEYPHRDIRCLTGEANDELKNLVRLNPWRRKENGPGRAVVFLDPYSLQVEWATLKALAETRVMDVWYLFPLRDVVRQLALRLSGVGPKEPKLDRILGPEWRDLYGAAEAKGEPHQLDLLGDIKDRERQASLRQIEDWFRGRLQSIFAYASEPLPLLTSPGRQAFSLFLAVSNPSRPATDLAKHFAKYVMRRYGLAASRRK